MAGLAVLDIVNEPTAAALSFGESLGYLTVEGEPRQPMKVLVYDLGGGTFDVTLLDLRPGDLRTIATDGDVQLGGHDWDMRLVELLRGGIQEAASSRPAAKPGLAGRARRGRRGGEAHAHRPAEDDDHRPPWRAYRPSSRSPASSSRS